MFDVGSLFDVDCRAAGNFLNKLAVPRTSAGQGTFVGHPI